MRKPDFKPPFKWTGGKNRMWGQYAPHFFPEREFTRFVDLFTGACSVGMWIAENYPKAEIVINDSNEELIELYTMIKCCYQPLETEYIKVVDKFLSFPEHLDKKKFYYELRDRHAFQYNEIDDVTLAAELLFMLKTNFNGMWKAYKKMDLKYSTPPGTLTQKPKFFETDSLRKFADFLSRTTIMCGDFEDTSKYISKDTFVYADPPYRDSIVDYKGGFDDKEQLRLITFLKAMSDCGALISESNKEIGDGFWKNNFDENYNIYEYNTKYTAGRGTTVTKAREVLITNYAPLEESEETMNKIDELIEKICEEEKLTTVEVLTKYPDLSKLKHEAELREKKEKAEKDKRQLLKG